PAVRRRPPSRFGAGDRVAWGLRSAVLHDQGSRIRAKRQGAERQSRTDPEPQAMTSTALIDELREALDPQRVRSGPTELSLYRRDASNMEGTTSVVCLPTNTAEVQACVRIAARHGVPFVPRGSGTGLAGGAVPLDGSVVIVTSKMNEVISVDTVNRQAWVQPGVLNLDLTRQLERFG